jgi:hypothetical protein
VPLRRSNVSLLRMSNKRPSNEGEFSLVIQLERDGWTKGCSPPNQGDNYYRG